MLMIVELKIKPKPKKKAMCYCIEQIVDIMKEIKNAEKLNLKKKLVL